MKKEKVLTTINLFLSVISWLLFTFNQLCNLRFLGLWAAWNLSGYAFVLLAGPVSLVFSCISTAIVCSGRSNSQKPIKLIVTNIICTVITGLLLLSCFAIPGTLTWA